MAFFFAEMRAGLDVEQTSVLSRASDIHTPVFLVHSKQDTYTNPENSQSVFDALTGLSDQEKGLYFTDWNAKHARSIDTNAPVFTEKVEDFLEKIQAARRLSGDDTTPQNNAATPGGLRAGG